MNKEQFINKAENFLFSNLLHKYKEYRKLDYIIDTNKLLNNKTELLEIIDNKFIKYIHNFLEIEQQYTTRISKQTYNEIKIDIIYNDGITKTLELSEIEYEPDFDYYDVWDLKYDNEDWDMSVNINNVCYAYDDEDGLIITKPIDIKKGKLELDGEIRELHFITDSSELTEEENDKSLIYIWRTQPNIDNIYQVIYEYNDGKIKKELNYESPFECWSDDKMYENFEENLNEYQKLLNRKLILASLDEQSSLLSQLQKDS